MKFYADPAYSPEDAKQDGWLRALQLNRGLDADSTLRNIFADNCRIMWNRRRRTFMQFVRGLRFAKNERCAKCEKRPADRPNKYCADCRRSYQNERYRARVAAVIISVLSICDQLIGDCWTDHLAAQQAITATFILERESCLARFTGDMRCQFDVMIEANQQREIVELAYFDCLFSSCMGDFDGDYVVGVDDLLLVINSWQNPYGLNHLLQVIGHWGECA